MSRLLEAIVDKEGHSVLSSEVNSHPLAHRVPWGITF